MNSKKYLIGALSVLLILPALDAWRKKKNLALACGKDEASCKDLKNPCRCFCAFKPGPRDKVSDDKPIYIEDDPEGNYCYCKERDIEKVNSERKERGDLEINY